MPISHHGLVFAIVQSLLVVGVWWGYLAWHRRDPAAKAFPILFVTLLVEYAILRYQPIRMGGDPFEYTLGLFDAATALGLAGLVMLHMLHRHAGRVFPGKSS